MSLATEKASQANGKGINRTNGARSSGDQLGSSSSDIRASAKLTVTGQTRLIKYEDRAFLSTATVSAQ